MQDPARLNGSRRSSDGGGINDKESTVIPIMGGLARLRDDGKGNYYFVRRAESTDQRTCQNGPSCPVVVPRSCIGNTDHIPRVIGWLQPTDADDIRNKLLGYSAERVIHPGFR